MQSPQKAIKILGIESSCDETSAAIVSSDREILALETDSQIIELKRYGGVVPEVSARAHLSRIEPVIARALKKANCSLRDIDGFCGTAGPGLIGGVIVGTMAAKTLASIHKKPYSAINHLEGHALAPRLSDKVSYPYLLLLISGGHCQFYMIHALGNYELLGGTIDDSVGEALDKTGRVLGFQYPAGPAIEQAALKGDPSHFDLPKPLIRSQDCNFSFSGLKTSARQKIEKLRAEGNLTIENINHFCATLQDTIGVLLATKAMHAIRLFKSHYPDQSHAHFVLSGGVASNFYFRSILSKLAAENGLKFCAPPPELCTDNAAMIAWAGIEHFLAGHYDPLDFAPRPRWPL